MEAKQDAESKQESVADHPAETKHQVASRRYDHSEGDDEAELTNAEILRGDRMKEEEESTNAEILRGLSIDLS
jgi:hypothetical protein